MHQPISFSLFLNFHICDSFENPKPCDEHGAYIIFIMTDVREQIHRNLSVSTSNIRTRQSQNSVQHSQFRNFVEDERCIRSISFIVPVQN